MNILSYTQHLQGIGHLVRSLRIAAEMVRAGLTVDLVIGGVAVEGLRAPGVRIHRLAPIKAGKGGFSDLVDAQGRPIDEDRKAARAARLVGLVEEVRPDAILIEAFPFGRRQMRFELLPFLDAAHARSPRPLVACSVRDILQQSDKPGRLDDTIAYLEKYFDLVLVHGDADFAALGATMPRACEFSAMTRHTGIVAGPQPAAASEAFDVLVSVGGGATRGERLLECALKARPLTRYAHGKWCFITGPNLPAREARALRAQAGPGVTVHEFRDDFASLMAATSVSVSQCGYNTAVDIFQTRCRAVVVPYAEHGESEQTRRAALLARRAIAQAVYERELSPETLAAAIERASDAPAPPEDAWPDLNGAAATARIVREAVERRGL